MNKLKKKLFKKSCGKLQQINCVHFYRHMQERKLIEERKESSLPIRANLIFEMFPFCILFKVKLFFFPN